MVLGWKAKPLLLKRANILVRDLIFSTIQSRDLPLHGKEALLNRIAHEGSRSQVFGPICSSVVNQIEIILCILIQWANILFKVDFGQSG